MCTRGCLSAACASRIFPPNLDWRTSTICWLVMRMFLACACALLDITERRGKYKRRGTWPPYLVLRTIFNQSGDGDRKLRGKLARVEQRAGLGFAHLLPGFGGLLLDLIGSATD